MAFECSIFLAETLEVSPVLGLILLVFELVKVKWLLLDYSHKLICNMLIYVKHVYKQFQYKQFWKC